MNKDRIENFAYTIFADYFVEVAKKAAGEAIQTISLEKILDSNLPGLSGDIRDQMLESGNLMKRGTISYVGIKDPSEVRWEQEESMRDAMTVSYDEEDRPLRAVHPF